MYYPRLRDLREDHDLTQKEVAAALGIDQRVYSTYDTNVFLKRLIIYRC